MQAKIYVKRTIYLAELKDAFSLESRQSVPREVLDFIQVNAYITIDFLIIDPKI